MSEPFLGQLALVGFNFAPIGWALCAGQLLSISQNTALFSLLGTTYGGDGKSTFALPNMQGAIPVSSGQCPGGSYYDLGELSGIDSVTLLQTEIPVHTHPMTAVTGRVTPVTSPAGAVFATATGSTPYQSPPPPLDQTLNGGVISPVGGSQPHNNIAPSLPLCWIIAMQGVFPQRP